MAGMRISKPGMEKAAWKRRFVLGGAGLLLHGIGRARPRDDRRQVPRGNGGG